MLAVLGDGTYLGEVTWQVDLSGLHKQLRYRVLIRSKDALGVEETPSVG